MFLNIGFNDQSKLFFFAVLYLKREKNDFKQILLKELVRKLKHSVFLYLKNWLDVKRSSSEISP